MTLPSSTENKARECDCPPWVERCAHVGDEFVQLCRADWVPNKREASTWPSPFSIDVPSDRPGFVSMVESHHYDYDAALAAFHAAEEALIRGEA